MFLLSLVQNLIIKDGVVHRQLFPLMSRGVRVFWLFSGLGFTTSQSSTSGWISNYWKSLKPIHEWGPKTNSIWHKQMGTYNWDFFLLRLRVKYSHKSSLGMWCASARHYQIYFIGKIKSPLVALFLLNLSISAKVFRYCICQIQKLRLYLTLNLFCPSFPASTPLISLTTRSKKIQAT